MQTPTPSTSVSSTCRRTAATLVGVVALAVVVLIPSVATSAGAAPSQAELEVVGSGTWGVRFNGDALVNGTGSFVGRRIGGGEGSFAATMGSIDRTLPTPGNCEQAYTTMTLYDMATPEIHLVGFGTVCTHPFNGRLSFHGDFDVAEGPKKVSRESGVFSIQWNTDGTATGSAATQ